MQKSTRAILNHFEHINTIPRCSKNEGQLQLWLKEWANARGFKSRADAAGNLVVRVPAARGCENAPTVVIQGHLDMVCEKTPDSDHNFDTDAITSHMDGDWLTADRTTLGADNGIAIAYALALAEDASLKRPTLELLFTVDEETGLNGVKAMADNLIEGRRLINLDSEDEGIFTIGCAGGVDTTIEMELQTDALGAADAWVDITIGGLTGGHSGIDIHKQRANANKLLARVLDRLLARVSCRLVRLSGGTRHNAIARDASLLLICESAVQDSVIEVVREIEQVVKRECGGIEPDLFLKAETISPSGANGLTPADTRRITDLLLAMPHGVAGMSQAVEGLVETSSNLATVNLEGGRLKVLSSQRSAMTSRLDEITGRVHAAARLAGAAARDTNAYPPWQPDAEAPLLRESQSVYRRLYKKEPAIQVIHAGLECAIIGDLYPGMEMISFGPTIRNPHSPAERLHVPSVEKVWQFLVALLSTLGS